MKKAGPRCGAGFFVSAHRGRRYLRPHSTQFTQAGLRVQRAKAILQQAVEIGVFLEPQGAVYFGEPEVSDGAGNGHQLLNLTLKVVGAFA